MILLISILLAGVIIWLFSAAISEKRGGGVVVTGTHTRTRKHLDVFVGTPAAPNGVTCVLIPGLGNGIESFNWNNSTADMRERAGLPAAASLQDKLTAAGYQTIAVGPPGQIKSLGDYCRRIHQRVSKCTADVSSTSAIIVVGHSIGARVAQLYAKMYGGAVPCHAVMIDPTPDYLVREINYTKHIDNPGVAKYADAAAYIAAAKSAGLDTLDWGTATVICSFEDADPAVARKREWFDALAAANKIAVKNKTHWLHITDQDTVVDAIAALR